MNSRATTYRITSSELKTLFRSNHVKLIQILSTSFNIPCIVKAPDFWLTTLMKFNSTRDVFRRILKNLAWTVISHITFRVGVSMLRVFITFCLYLLLKTTGVKLFSKMPKILWRIATFYSYQVFPFEFCKTFIKSRFSEHRHGFAFGITYDLQKEK